MLVNNTACLCGYFSAKQSVNSDMLQGWERESCSDTDFEELSNYYLPEFATFMTKDMVRYNLPIGKPSALRFSENEVAGFMLNSLHLWCAPFDLVLFAIEIKFENIDFNLMTRCLNALRNCGRYNELQADFARTGLQPVVDLYNKLTHNSLTLNGNLCQLIQPGNKFKLFQAITLTEPLLDDNVDYLLFDAGTLAKHIPNSLGMNSKDYYENIMADRSISVFNGWKGLALLDTFTMLSIDTPEWVVNNWNEDYFGKIYVYQLFRKVFLYNINLCYRKRSVDVELLEQQLDRFEQDYSFSTISYNFLPDLINNALEKSFATQQDNEQLYHMISKEMGKREQRAEEKTNKFLTFLTCLTIFSAIYDFSSLVNESFDYSQWFRDTTMGFRAVSTMLLIIVAAAYLVVILKYRKKK